MGLAKLGRPESKKTPLKQSVGELGCAQKGGVTYPPLLALQRRHRASIQTRLLETGTGAMGLTVRVYGSPLGPPISCNGAVCRQL